MNQNRWHNRNTGQGNASKMSGAPQLPDDSAPVNGQPISDPSHEISGELPKQTNSNRPVSRRKHRFMSLVLGKLGVKHEGADTLESRAPGQSPPVRAGIVVGNTPPSRLQLNETVAGPSSGAPAQTTMKFTYPPGSKPLSQYTIRRGVGVGGFGEVYFAVSEAGKEVALKRIQRNLEIEIRGVSQCLNLKHPNLVALFDICRDDADQAWVVMEYVNGPNLRSVLDQSPDGLSEVEIQRWFKAIAAGVQHLHSAGLVHRDLKPGNVFDDLGIVKLGDYGLSKFISASHRGGHTESVGTFHYMAPEIGRGQYGREIDVYALGVILFELVTGQVPFDGESCHEIIVKHLTAQPDLSRLPAKYRGVIARALKKDPQDRQSNVREMLAELGWDDGVESETIAPVPIPLAEEVVMAEPVLYEPVARFADLAPVQQGYVSEQAVAEGVTPTRDEPLARAVRESLRDLKRWWRTLDNSPGSKKLLIFAAGIALLLNTSWLLPALSLLGIFYVPYYIVRQMVLHTNQQPTYAEAQRIAVAVGGPSLPKTPEQWRNHVRGSLRGKRWIHRAAELSSSWIAATFTVMALTLVAGVIGLRTGEISAFTLAPFAWIAVVVLMASLSVLSIGKLWEQDEGEPLPRRLVMAGIGAGVGVAAYSLATALMVKVGTDGGMYHEANEMPQALYKVSGDPRPAAFMAHFALLFFIVRWWRPVDPLRKTRLSLWNVMTTVVVAWGVHLILPLPQPYGMMIAGGIAVAVQMAAPWIDPRKAQESEHGADVSPAESHFPAPPPAQSPPATQEYTV